MIFLLTAALGILQDETAAARIESVPIEMKLDGTLEPAERIVVQIRPQAWSGDLTVLQAAPHGARVAKGDVLLRLDAARWKDAVAATEADLAAARARLEKAALEARSTDQAEDLALTRLEREAREAADRLAHYQNVEMALALQDADLRLQSAADSVTDQKEELEQLEKMYQSEELATPTAEIVVRRARRSLERARKQLAATEARVEWTRKFEIPSQLERHKGEAAEKGQALEAMRKSSPKGRAERDAALARTTGEIRRQEEALVRLRRDGEAFEAVAPADGTVYYGRFDQGAWHDVEERARGLRAGEKVPANQVLLTIVPDVLAARVAIPEDRLAEVPPEIPARVRTVAFPDRPVEGKGAFPNLAGGRKGDAYEARILLASADPRLVPGLKAKVDLVLGVAKDIVVIPPRAIRMENGRSLVRVVVSGASAPEEREVEVGRRWGDERVEIRSGLKDGEVVLLHAR